MRSQRLLLSSKRHRRRRWSFLRNDLAVRHCRGGCGDVTCRRSFRTEYAFARRSHSHSSTYWRRCDLLRAHLHARLRHRLCTGEGMLWDHHHRTLYIAVRVRDVRDGRSVVDDGRVVDGGHLRDVHRRITDVDAIHVCLAHVVRRNINFPRPNGNHPTLPPNPPGPPR